MDGGKFDFLNSMDEQDSITDIIGALQKNERDQSMGMEVD